MPRFTLPRDIYFGENALENLKTLKGYKRAVIVTGGSAMQKHGFLEQTEKLLKETGLETKLIEGVEPDPSIETVYKGAKIMEEFQPDVIVSIGGGSPIDAAKAMWVFYEHPDLTFDDIKEPFSIPPLRKKAIFVAIPSTSGTATEVTAFSVITDYSTNIKYPLADFEITPDIAILDYKIPLTMHKQLIAHTGMDALTHAIEAYTSTASNPVTDSLAIYAISMIYENLEAFYNGCKDSGAQVHLAQCMAGMAFSNALLGIVHSMAHKTGAEFDIPHGCCNALLLPYVIQYNQKTVCDRFAHIAKIMGLQGRTDKQLTNSLVKEIKALNKKLNIKQTFNESGVTEQHFLEKVDEISKNAALDPCTFSNPRKAEAEDIKRILTCAFYGNEVSF